MDQVQKTLELMVASIMQIDDGNPRLIAAFVRSANDGLRAEGIPYRFRFINTSEEFDVRVISTLWR